MHLLFSRHGNTFESGQPAVWVGARNDLPLTAAGRAQAEFLAENLKQRRILPARLYCAPLLRTREYAEIVCDRLALPEQPLVDKRLTELDYGAWSGLSSEEIAQNFGPAVLDDWEKRCIWPKDCGWGSNQAEVLQELRDLVSECSAQLGSSETALFVTSNGRLRFLLKLVPGEFEMRAAQGTLKVKTGHVCLLESGAAQLGVEQWNISPAQLQLKG